MTAKANKSALIRTAILFAPTIVLPIIAHFLPKIPQPNSYHDFAGKRKLLPLVPNTMDVISNLPFLFFGLMGLREIRRNKQSSVPNQQKIMWLTAFIGMIATCFGSGFYHLIPNNHTLIFDRLPMAIAFAPLISTTLYECVSPRIGSASFIPALLFNVGSALYWYMFDDLRWFSVAQILAGWFVAATPLLMNSKYSHSMYYEIVALLYGLAKVCESMDRVIFTLDLHTLSGHTMKHIYSSLAVYVLVKMLQERKVALR